LLIPPTNFTTGTYKLRSTPAGALPTDEDLFGTLTRGLHGTSMQPWRDLPASDRWALVAHLKSLSPRFDREPRGRPVLVPIAPRETGDLLDEGENAGPRAPGSRRPEPRDFSRGRFLRGAEMEDIYVTLKVGIEGTPMYPYPALYDDELWAVAA
jgi:cytochrome c oxidase cbb3-type subunit 2